VKDFCDKHYGFMHLPSLFVFINPYSPYDSVQQFLFKGSLDEVDSYVKSLPLQEATDLAQRVTSLVHESKHFHDLLMTPYGNFMFRRFFSHALKCRSLLQTANLQTGVELELPLDSNSVSSPDMVHRMFASLERCSTAIASARETFEASATMAQMQHAWTYYGPTVRDRLELDFAQTTEYSLVRTGLTVMLVDDPESAIVFSPLVHELLIHAMCTPNPDKFLYEMLIGLVKLPFQERQDRLQRAMEQGRQGLLKQLSNVTSENQEYIDELRPAIHEFHADVADEALGAYEDFAANSAELRSRVLEEPSTYWNMERYVRGESWNVSPIVCFYSADDRFSLTPNREEANHEDKLWEYATFKNQRTGEPLYSPRLLQTDVQMFDSAKIMDRKIWNKFTLLIGCYPVLVENVDWLHPLYGYWLRQKFKGVGVRRRWAKSPSGQSPERLDVRQESYPTGSLNDELRVRYERTPSLLTAAAFQANLITSAYTFLANENLGAARPLVLESLNISQAYSQRTSIVARGLVLALAFMEVASGREDMKSIIELVRLLWDGNAEAADETVMMLVGSLEKPSSAKDVITTIASINLLAKMFPDNRTVAVTIDTINEKLRSADASDSKRSS
jgi:hypothetical protein